VKYGFTLKQWFVNRGSKRDYYSSTLSWCNSLGYRLVKVKDLTNVYCPNNDSDCSGSVGATPPSPSNHYQRRIGSGFFTEWGRMYDYSGVGFIEWRYWTSDPIGISQFIVNISNGRVSHGHFYSGYESGLCSHP
ncbi:hypothetical protein, partial [Gilliamella sp. B3493]